MSIHKTIGQTIVYLRKKKGFTQERLALECEISSSYLRLIEHGDANPTIAELMIIVRVLEIEFMDLIDPETMKDKAT